jgi:predicted HicB family RNase H-like nuclease
MVPITPTKTKNALQSKQEEKPMTETPTKTNETNEVETIELDIDDELYAALTQAAAEEDITIDEYVQRAVEEYLETLKRQT